MNHGLSPSTQISDLGPRRRKVIVLVVLCIVIILAACIAVSVFRVLYDVEYSWAGTCYAELHEGSQTPCEITYVYIRPITDENLPESTFGHRGEQLELVFSVEKADSVSVIGSMEIDLAALINDAESASASPPDRYLRIVGDIRSQRVLFPKNQEVKGYIVREGKYRFRFDVTLVHYGMDHLPGTKDDGTLRIWTEGVGRVRKKWVYVGIPLD